jgi:deoxyribodipyrimidine photo-lyase
MHRTILWFRTDLRLADNSAMVFALATSEEVLPVYVLDPRQIGATPFGFTRMGPYRAQFLLESLTDLDQQLRQRGSALHVIIGDPARAIAELAEQWGAGMVRAQQLGGWEEQQQERAVAQRVPLTLHGPSTLLHPQDLPFQLEQLPHVFTRFRHLVEAVWLVRDALPEPNNIPSPQDWTGSLPTLADLGATAPSGDPRAAWQFKGGRAAAMERLKHYLWDTRSLGRYKETRNGLLGADYSSRFSPWLAQGAVGPREIYQQVKRYEHHFGANESTYWLVFELLWRDFFHFTAMKHGADFFKRGGIGRNPASGDQDPGRFAAWCEGRTGQPFIDANMRELAATGWMSNRGRQNVASYLVHDLGLDWRMGAYWFERLLVDHDPCSNWGNWQYIAGVGNDPRPLRRFLPDRQAAMYDPDGAYQRLWCGDS